MTLHLLEQLVATNPECEIWWDSSPLIYESWRDTALSGAPDAVRSDWAQQLSRLLDPATLRSTGQMGFRGVTTNPPLCLQAFQLDPVYWADHIRELARDFASTDIEGIYWAVYLEMVQKGAEMVLPAFEASHGGFGFVSGQVDPRKVANREEMLEQGLDIAAQGRNVMVKIPGSEAGYEVIEELTARGISTNNTTSFTVPQYLRCMSAISTGLERARANAVDLSCWRSVITHMSARLGELSDWRTEAKARGIELSLSEIRDGEEAVLKRAYWHGKEQQHPSKMLQCSMRIELDERTGKIGSRHLSDVAGGDLVYTCPPSFVAGLMTVAGEFAPFDKSAIEREPNPKSLAKLLKLPSFRAAYEFDGMQPSEFAHFGAFKATETEFANATRQTIDFVRRSIDAV